MMNHYRNIIIAPIVTEKSTNLKDQENSYTFKVSTKANKIEIKQAIEKLFNVKVSEVNTINVKPKNKRYGRTPYKTSKYKKAIVKLAEGNEINFD